MQAKDGFDQQVKVDNVHSSASLHPFANGI